MEKKKDVKSGTERTVGGPQPPNPNYKKSEPAIRQTGSEEKTKPKAPEILQMASLSFAKSGTTSNQRKPFVRCSHEIKTQDLIRQVIMSEWKLPVPRIAILIISNINHLYDWSNSKQIKSFQKGLMKAAENTNMWCIVNGIDIGCTNIIGDAINTYMTEEKHKSTYNLKKLSNFHFIGIVDENRLKYGQKITSNEESVIELTDEGYSGTDGKYLLNPYLTHYVLVKDDTSNKSGVNGFLTKLVALLNANQREAEDIISNECMGESFDGSEELSAIEKSEIPVVALVIKGGVESSRLVLEQVKQRIPVVVFRGTGGLADLLAFVYTEIIERGFSDFWDPEFAESYLKPELTIKIVESFPNLRQNAVLCDKFRDRILDTVRKSRRNGLNYITIINMFENSFYSTNLENLTEYLLSALFRSQRAFSNDAEGLGSDPTRSRFTQVLIREDLNLCVDWNSPEMAKREVLSKDPTFSINNEKKLFELSMTRPNRWQFVDLFLLQKFNLRFFVSPPRLRRMFKRIHSQEFFSTICWEGILVRNKQQKQSDVFLERDLNWLIEACTGIRGFINEEEIYLIYHNLYPLSEREAYQKSLEILVFWALFDFRKELVRILWRHSDRPVHLAIVITMTYERLSWYTSDQALSIQLKEESNQFIKYASDVLEAINKDSPQRAELVLNESTRDWKFKTPVDLAAFGRIRLFFSHQACQRWITDQLYGNIAIKDLRCGLIRVPTMAKLLLSAYLIFPLWMWVSVPSYSSVPLSDAEKSESEGKEKSDKQHKDSNDLEEGDDESSKVESKDKPKFIANKPNRKMVDNVPAIAGAPILVLLTETWNAPITKFWNFQFFYTCYLSTFSVAVLYPRCGNYWLDLVVCLWTALIMLDTIRQIYLYRIRNINYNLFTRVFEISFQSTFLFSYIYGRLMSGAYEQKAAYHEKIIMCVALLYAYYVLFSVFLPISSTLGPLIYRLRIMVLVDFINFIRLSILAMIGFGVVLQAILYPDMAIDMDLFRRLFHRTVLSLFTVFFTELDPDLSPDCVNALRKENENMDANYTCTASTYTKPTCRVTGWPPYMFLIAYYVLLKLILMTLLFAIFASSDHKLAPDTDNIYKFQRYGLVMNFATRNPLPPPLNIFYYIYIMFRYLWSLCTIKQQKDNSFFQEVIQILLPKAKERSNPKSLESDDYPYFRSLASNVYDKYERKQDSEGMAAQLWELTKANSEELEHERRVLRQLSGKMSEMDRSVRQSLVHLESIKHLMTRIESLSSSDTRILDTNTE